MAHTAISLLLLAVGAMLLVAPHRLARLRIGLHRSAAEIEETRGGRVRVRATLAGTRLLNAIGGFAFLFLGIHGLAR